jgi:hypothetical protein
MNRIVLIICGVLWVQACLSQQTYFNNRYELEQDWWDVTKSIVNLDTAYLIGGGTVDVPTNTNKLGALLIDSAGQEIILRTFGGGKHQFIGFYNSAIINTYDGGFIYTGQVQDTSINSASGYLFKLDQNLDSLWFVQFDTSFLSYGAQVRQLSDSGFIVAGTDDSLGHWQFFLLRTDKYGNKIWKKTYGGTGSEGAQSINVTADGGFVVGGNSSSFGGSLDGYLIKMDSSGIFQWERNFGTPEHEGIGVVAATANGDVLFSGIEYKYTDGQGFDYKQGYIARLSSNNDSLWKYFYGPEVTPSSGFSKLKEMDDGSIVAIGYVDDVDTLPTSNVSGMILKLDSNGTEVWLRKYITHDTLPSDNYFWDFDNTIDGGYVIAGHIVVVTNENPLEYYQDSWVIKLDSLGCPYPGCELETGLIEINHNLKYGEMTKVFPNPTKEQISITGYYKLPAKMKIYKINGQLVQEVSLTSKYQTVNLDDCSSGSYLYQVSDVNSQISKGKFVVE